MKEKMMLWTLSGILCLAIGIMAGCSSPGVNLAKNGTVIVERIPSEKIGILWTDVYQENDSLRVKGVVKRQHYSGAPMKTHLDIVLLKPDGTVLSKNRTSDINIPRRQPHKGCGLAHFEASIPSPTSPGVVVRTIVHSDDQCVIRLIG